MTFIITLYAPRVKNANFLLKYQYIIKRRDWGQKSFWKKRKIRRLTIWRKNMYGCARHSVRETYCSTLNPCSFPITLGNGSKDSFTIRGWQLWLKQWICTLHALYFLRVFCVSSCVLNEFIRTSGTEHPYVLFKCCREKTKFFGKHVHMTEMSHRSPRWLCYRSNLISGFIILHEKFL